MKKILIALLVACVLFSFVSCGKKAETATTTTTTTVTPAPAATTTVETKAEVKEPEAPAKVEEVKVEIAEPVVEAAKPMAETPKSTSGKYKLGMGVVYSDSSTSTQAAYSATVAAVVVDENGVIVDAKIDCAQNKMNGDAIDPEKTFKSKYELGFDYNMVKFSEATNEWFQQADAFAKYVVGKTAEEVAAMPTRVRGEDEPHPGYVVTTDETLFASCSISVPDFIEAVVKAATDPYAQEFETKSAINLGVKCVSTAEDSTAPAEGKNGFIKMYVEFAAAVVDNKGVILAAVTDAIQPSHEVDEFDEIVNKTYKGTKKELGFDYNMVKYSEATNEWFQQAAAFEDYCVGKTADEVLALPTRVRGPEEAHPGYVVTADEALFASCSISIPGFQAVIAGAAKNALPVSTYKLGMGVVYSDSSTSTQAAYSATVAAVVVDENGVIVDAKIDCAQNKMNGDAIDPEKTFKSKYELGFDYNMVKFSEATNEWFQQADAFAEYVVGKTAEEVAAMPTRVRGEDEPHPGYVVTTDETLFASCSISVPDFIEAVVKAATDPYAQEFEASSFALGVACNSTAEDSTAPADGKNGTIKMYVEFAAATVGEDGKILATVTDAIQPSHEVDEFDEIVKTTYKGTKKELGFDYNMVKYSEATNEWFQQAAAFEDYCVGKTADEVLALPTRVRGPEEAHPGYVVTADEALFASCSISIPGFQSVIAKAAKNALPVSTYKLGMGVVYSDSSTSTQAAYSATVAAVVVDENGVIVDAKIDCAQNKMNGDAIDPEKTFKSKYELGYDYNMVKFSEATNEWFQQADAFAEYVVGKTAEEVAAMPTRVRGEDEPHPGYVVTTDETLFASCSISVPDFIEAVVKAATDPYAQEFEASSFALGVACNSTAEDSTAPADGKNGFIKMYVEFAAATVGEDGKILATVTDAIQPSHEVDEFDEIVKTTYKGTKKELGFDYNMVKYSEATNEWFQQAAAFEDYCVGKTADEVLALPTRVRGPEEAHPGYVVTADEALFASCSISIPGFQSVIAKAAKNAE